MEDEIMLIEGSTLPNIDFATDCNGVVNFKKYIGKFLVVYFYPKDDTSGCTLEAKDFTELYAKFKEVGCEVIGISKDDINKHKKFREKYSLLPILGSAAETTMLEEFGVWKEKSMYGKKYMGIERSTFLIDKEGIIVKVWRNVKVPGHANDVFESLKQISQR